MDDRRLFFGKNGGQITTKRMRKIRFPRMLRVAVRIFPIHRKMLERAEKIFFMEVVLEVVFRVKGRKNLLFLRY